MMEYFFSLARKETGIPSGEALYRQSDAYREILQRPDSLWNESGAARCVRLSRTLFEGR